jgi:hypothetical protein
VNAAHPFTSLRAGSVQKEKEIVRCTPGDFAFFDGITRFSPRKGIDQVKVKCKNK